MTEDEAGKKRCCGPNGCGEVRDDGTGAPSNQKRFCIGSACMGWVWGVRDPAGFWSEVAPDPSVPRRDDVVYGGDCGLKGTRAGMR